MAKKIDFAQLPVMEQQEGDTVAAYRKGRVVRIPAGAGGGSTPLPDLATVATTGKYSDLLNKPVLGTAASKDSAAFATAEQGTKADTAYSWGDHSQAGYAQASAVASALSSKVDRVSGASLYPDADAVKLGGIASGATKNATDTTLLDRGNHTGNQLWNTISNPPATATRWPTFTEVTGKPTTYAPSPHTHPVSEITGLSDAATTPVASIRSGTTAANVGLGSVRNVASYSQTESDGRYEQKTNLKSAAYRDVGTGSGNVMEVGAFGLGYAKRAADFAERIDSGFYLSTGGSVGMPSGMVPDGGWMINVNWQYNQTGNRYNCSFYGNVQNDFIGFRRIDRYGVPQAPVELYHTGNIQSTTGQSTAYPMSQKATTDAMSDHLASGDHDGRYYTKAQTDALVAGATTDSNVWQNATTALIKNAYNKVAFPSPKTLTLPSNPTENDYVAIITSSGNMQGSKIARNGKTIMGLAEDMEINMLVTYLRLDYVNGSWRIAS